MENAKIVNLYDLSHTQAAEYLSGFDYPWETLDGIKKMIIDLGNSLDPELYNKVGENVWISKTAKIYQVIFVLMIVVGATTSLDVAWDVADTFNGLMAIPNFIALFALSGVVAKLTKEYFADKTKLK